MQLKVRLLLSYIHADYSKLSGVFSSCGKLYIEEEITEYANTRLYEQYHQGGKQRERGICNEE